MPPHSVSNIVNCYLDYFYAKHCLAPLAGRDHVWPYMMHRYQLMQKGEISFDTADAKLLSWLSNQKKCLFCQKSTTARGRMIRNVDCPFNRVPFCSKCQKSKGAEQVWDWWIGISGNKRSNRPNLPAALWLRMAYERHSQEGTLEAEVATFEDLWKWPEDGEDLAMLQDADTEHDDGVSEDVWRSDPTGFYPWVGDPTVGQLLSWSYAQLAVISVILKRGDFKFQSKDYLFRKSFFERMYAERISPTSLREDEKERLTRRAACVYCGCAEGLSLDHLLPQSKGGPDEGFNLVLACRSCNSAKRNVDLLVWYHEKKDIPPTHLLRRYLKLVVETSKKKLLWNRVVTEVTPDALPFDFQCLPPAFPDLRTLLKKEEAYNAIFFPPQTGQEPEVGQLTLGLDFF